MKTLVRLQHYEKDQNGSPPSKRSNQIEIQSKGEQFQTNEHQPETETVQVQSSVENNTDDESISSLNSEYISHLNIFF